MSMARRVFPSRLELKSPRRSSKEAPQAKVSLTTWLYASPVQMIPAWDHTGTPNGFVGLIHLHSSTMSGSASWMRRRTSATVSAPQPPRDRIRSSMRREAALSFARFTSAPGLVLVPAFGGDLDLAADWRGLLSRDVPLPFGFALLSVIIRPLS